MWIAAVDFTKRMIKDGDKFKEQLLEMLKVADFNINNLEVKEASFKFKMLMTAKYPRNS